MVTNTDDFGFAEAIQELRNIAALVDRDGRQAQEGEYIRATVERIKAKIAATNALRDQETRILLGIVEAEQKARAAVIAMEKAAVSAEAKLSGVEARVAKIEQQYGAAPPKEASVLLSDQITLSGGRVGQLVPGNPTWERVIAFYTALGGLMREHNVYEIDGVHYVDPLGGELHFQNVYLDLRPVPAAPKSEE